MAVPSQGSARTVAKIWSGPRRKGPVGVFEMPTSVIWKAFVPFADRPFVYACVFFSNAIDDLIKLLHRVEAIDRRLMSPGAMIRDVSIDQGGCTESLQPTAHSEPAYMLCAM